MHERMKAAIILNPAANSQKARQSITAIRKAFDRADFKYDLSVTQRPQHATELAHAAAQNGVDMIIAAGGDGTVNEVINGMVTDDSRPTKPLGIIPIGTGNDFTDMHGLTHDIETMVQLFKRGVTRQVDVGRVSTAAGHTHYFDNNCALAMEPMIALANQRQKRFKGRLGYLYAVLKALFNLKAWDMTIDIDGQQQRENIYLFSVCNGPRTGSTFLMYPDAKIDDGLFDVVVVPEIPMRTVFQILPRLLNGSHLSHPAVRTFHARTLTVHSRPGTPVHADGELLADAAETVRYSLLPGKLTLMTV